MQRHKSRQQYGGQKGIDKMTYEQLIRKEIIEAWKSETHSLLEALHIPQAQDLDNRIAELVGDALDGKLAELDFIDLFSEATGIEKDMFYDFWLTRYDFWALRPMPAEEVTNLTQAANEAACDMLDRLDLPRPTSLRDNIMLIVPLWADGSIDAAAFRSLLQGIMGLGKELDAMTRQDLCRLVLDLQIPRLYRDAAA